MAAKRDAEVPEGEEEARNEASLQAFRDALDKSVTISRERLQEVLDDAVRRGRMTRGDAEDLVGRLVAQAREQAEELLGEVESTVRHTARKARDRADEPLKSADRLRRKAGLPGFPIIAYDQLSVPQINNRLRELNPDELREVLAYETANRNRVGVLRSLERKLEGLT